MSSDGYYGDFDSFADEQRAYEKMLEEQYMDEHGSCPNCNAPVHVSDLGDEKGVVCCRFCHEHVQEQQNSLQWKNATIKEKILILKLCKII